ncbi:MAG: DUF5996 family protein [Terriglobales bacterium]
MPSTWEPWPALPLQEWNNTYRTLHMWLQIVGKIRMTLTPRQNHWWNAALYLTPVGLTTSAIPDSNGAFEIEFDFIQHAVRIRTSWAGTRSLPLAPMSVAQFYRKFMAELRAAGIAVQINPRPQEIPQPVPFDLDDAPGAYDAAYANRCWRILLSTHTVLGEFQARFLGKASPVHFFWGSFDLAYTRFCGRTAPPRKGVISSEAYSHECSSVGWWPGGGAQEAAFYAYTAPAPPTFATRQLRPAEAYFDTKLGEFLLPYDAVRQSASPAKALLDFAQSAYEAGVNLARWDRATLEPRAQSKL